VLFLVTTTESASPSLCGVPVFSSVRKSLCTVLQPSDNGSCSGGYPRSFAISTPSSTYDYSHNSSQIVNQNEDRILLSYHLGFGHRLCPCIEVCLQVRFPCLVDFYRRNRPLSSKRLLPMCNCIGRAIFVDSMAERTMVMLHEERKTCPLQLFGRFSSC
jgi:hypothetical protein